MRKKRRTQKHCVIMKNNKNWHLNPNLKTQHMFLNNKETSHKRMQECQKQKQIPILKENVPVESCFVPMYPDDNDSNTSTEATPSIKITCKMLLIINSDRHPTCFRMLHSRTVNFHLICPIKLAKTCFITTLTF